MYGLHYCRDAGGFSQAMEPWPAGRQRVPGQTGGQEGRVALVDNKVPREDTMGECEGKNGQRGKTNT